MGTKVQDLSHPIDTLEESIKLLAANVKDRADKLSSSLNKRSTIKEEVEEILRSSRYLLSLAIAEHLLGLRASKMLKHSYEILNPINHLGDGPNPDYNLTH